MSFTRRKKPAWLNAAVEYGPLLLFFIVYYLKGLMAATVVLMVTAPVGLAVTYCYEKKLPKAALFTASSIILFGGLTLLLEDETFIKMKLTIIQAAFGTVLVGGLLFKKPLLKPLMERAWKMTEEGWRVLTLRFALYFFAMAAINEIVWRTQSTDFWVSFKVFAPMITMMLFIVAQYPMITRHHIPDDEAPQ